MSSLKGRKILCTITIANKIPCKKSNEEYVRHLQEKLQNIDEKLNKT